MAIIDYHSIKSLKFAKLSRSSRILIPVLSCLCDDWDGSISRENSKHHVLAMYAGLSIASIKRALKELKANAIISIQTQSGRPASIQYLPQLKLSAKMQRSSQRPTYLAHSELPLRFPEATLTPVDKEPVSYGTDVAELTSSNQRLKNRQAPDIADLVGHALVKRWIGLRTGDFVTSVLLNMGKKNGEIQDYPGYFVSCCRNNWVPSSKKAEREAAAEAARQERTLYEEAETQRWERIRQSVITEESDPEAQARIRNIQETFLQTLGEPEVVHNPPA